MAQRIFHHKESLVLLRPFERGLLLHFLYFKEEIRDFSWIGKGEGEKVSSDELDLAKIRSADVGRGVRDRALRGRIWQTR